MIKIVENQHLFEVKADSFVNPANAIGWLGGFLGKHVKSSGISEAIQYSTKGRVEKLTKEYCKKNKPSLGGIYSTSADTLPYKEIIHVVTVSRPGLPTSKKVIEKCVENLKNYCLENNVKSCVLTGLGTGTGLVDIHFVAKLYALQLQESQTEFLIVDKNQKFVQSLKEYMRKSEI